MSRAFHLQSLLSGLPDPTPHSHLFLSTWPCGLDAWSLLCSGASCGSLQRAKCLPNSLELIKGIIPIGWMQKPEAERPKPTPSSWAVVRSTQVTRWMAAVEDRTCALPWSLTLSSS